VLSKARAALLTAALMARALSGSRAEAQEAPPPPPAPDTAPAEAPAPPALPALEERLREIDQRSLNSQRNLERLDEAAAARKAADPVVVANERGFGFRAPDDLFAIRLGGILDVDGRWYLDDEALAATADTFLVRKARPVLQATLFDVADVRIMPELAGGTPALWDGFADLRILPGLAIRGGKFKTALGLERYQSEPAVVFPERSLVSSLAPNRDVGFVLVATLLGGAILAEGGVVNGSPDNSIEETDLNHAKDFVGRLFVLPWRSASHSFLANLGVGIGASTGNQKGRPAQLAPRARPAVPGLPSYRSPGQQTFFSYLVNDAAADSTTLARGRRTRWSPQGYWYAGPFGVFGEYIQNHQRVAKGTSSATLVHRAWHAAAFLVLGGRPLFEGVAVSRPFAPRKGTWGALELAARYHGLDIDEDTFPTFADPSAAASRAEAWGAALNWHWNRNIRLSVAFERTRFEGGAAGGADRKTENVLFHRLQGAF
jgi:phosphate-selective porin OprO/OprP